MEVLGIAFENVLVGVLAALFVGLLVRTKNVAYDKYLERQYPIAGEYITTFEDLQNGETVTVTAPARLHQRGKTITGRTELPGDDREWHIEGELSENGYVNGIYYAVDPHDKGVGNLFLYVNYNRRMEGLWSGYDEVNDEISSGRYTFVPVFDAFTVRPLTVGNVPAAVDIAEQRLGRDYLSAELLQRSLDDDSNYFTRVATVDTDFEDERSIATRLADALLDRGPTVDDSNGPSGPSTDRVIGFCLGAVFDDEGLKSYLNVPERELPKPLQYADRIGVVRTIAVSEGFENRGVGTELVEECIEGCLDRGANALCAVGWEENGRVNVEGIMDHFGFKEETRIEEYWRDVSLEEGFHCEHCGEPPCTCSAVIFSRY